MKKTIIFFLLTCFLALSTTGTYAQSDKMQWWKDGKFGLFLHWGLYSVGHWNGKPQNGNEHFMFYEKIPIQQYLKLADSMDLSAYHPDLWVKYAKDAGMKYVVITAKHHDGFAMYNSPSNSNNIFKKAPRHIDPMIGLATACKKYGLKLGFYYSLGRDWESPYTYGANSPKTGNSWDYPNSTKKDYQKYIDGKVKPQLKELLTQYGPVGLIWFDTPEITTAAQSEDLRKYILSLQPNCIVNSRIGNGYGDYEVSEQKIAQNRETKPWEACITMSRKWGYSKFDKEYKSPELLVRQLVEIVCKGGNLLLNTGPDNRGQLTADAVDNLKAIGRWMNKNSDAIYGTEPYAVLNEFATLTAVSKEKVEGKSDNDITVKKISEDLYFCKKNNNIYLFARNWNRAEIISKSLGPLKGIKSITYLGNGKKVEWQQENGELRIKRPLIAATEIPVYTFKIEL